jgi:3-mercaptopyruvate sulfurtransferase SseA
MSKIKIFLTLSFILLILTACAALSPIAPTAEPTQTAVVIIEPTTPPQKSSLPASEAGVPRVSIEEAKVALYSGAAIIIDVRSKQAYEAGHIPGARNISLGEFESNINGIDIAKDQWIITYCT